MNRTNVTRSGNGSLNSSSMLNQKAALAIAYQELGKELSSGKLKVVGNYTLQRPIGEGTYGKVRLGLHRLTNARVAIKQIPKAHSASLTREIHHHRRLHHPHVMQLYEVIASEHYIWMVSELCAGGELYDYLVERQVLPEPEARRVFGQLCLAVAYIHDKGIVHRDLKLENILLDEQCNVKLGDFGFTREFEGKKLMDTFCGTTGYAAPEMLAGKRYTGQEVDIWSLGIILYALLCGALPFDDDNEPIMKQKILQGEYEMPECLSQEAQDLIRAVLQLDPTKRPNIKTILSHPWFSKTMTPSPMSTVDEDAQQSSEYFSSFAPSADAPDTSARASFSTGIDVHDPPHKGSASEAYESSFHSVCSDSESSGKRSSTTDLTDPTFSDIFQPPSSQGSDKVDDQLAALPSKQTIGLHRNESQTTIKRTGSNSSDTSFGTSSAVRATSRSASSSLPTHHELPASGETEVSDRSHNNAPSMSTNLSKRGSQSSSRGHHRTPSRTKRRSLSKSGLSDHHPPLLGSRPVDYVAQLTSPQPTIFTTPLEQNLLHQLSTLGIDVGQMVHSIVTDACDASGALWWMLLRKAEEKQSATVASSFSTPAPFTNNPVVVPTTSSQGYPLSTSTNASPPPLPEKDPSRRSQDQTPTFISGSRSLDFAKSLDHNPRRLQTVISHEELDTATTSQIATSKSMSESSGQILVQDPVASLANASSLSTPVKPCAHATSSSSSPENKFKTNRQQPAISPSHIKPSKTSPALSTTATSTSTPEIAKGKAPQDRPRSNSLSMKSLASSVLGSSREKPQPPIHVNVAGESLILERSRSPSIFGKKNANKELKDANSSLIGRISNPPTPKKGDGNEHPSPEKSKKSININRKMVETEIDRVKASDRTHSAASSPGRFSGAEESREPSTASVDSFSTLSMTPQSSEKGGKPRPKTSFLSTVRTWLGSNEKQSRKPKASKKTTAAKGLSPVLTNEVARHVPTQAASRTAMARRRSNHYQHTLISRRSSKILMQQQQQAGSISRRSSTGSSQHFSVDTSHPSLHRPANLGRLSAGSITPTATLYGGGGDAGQEHGGTMQGYMVARSSRPSSAHSTHRSGLHGKTGSTGSIRPSMKKSASNYSSSSGRRHGRRLSYEYGTKVMQHRAYGSANASPSRRDSRNGSRSGSVRSRNSSPGRGPLSPEASETKKTLYEVDEHGRSDRSGISTPRRSLYNKATSASHNAQPHQHQHQQPHPHPHPHHHTVFVAHKSRSPYKPPSTNPSLQAAFAKVHSPSLAAPPSSSALSGQLPAAGTGTWRHSWGRPPPSWAGSVDPPPPKSSTSPSDECQSKPKVRDVFANRDGDDDWTDEDDEPAYSGGLGQLDGSGWTTSVSLLNPRVSQGGSPHSTRKYSSSMIGSSMSTSTMPPNAYRYAGVRTMFQPPSLGNEFAPKMLSTVLYNKDDDGGGDGSKDVTMVAGTNATIKTTTTTVTSSISSPTMPVEVTTTIPSSGSRIRTASAVISTSAFNGNHIIEEEEEDE